MPLLPELDALLGTLAACGILWGIVHFMGKLHDDHDHDDHDDHDD